MEFAVGTLLLGRWELVAPLGSGLGGETWLARGHEGHVAVKILRQESAFAGGFASLLREAMLLRSVTHPHLVRYRGVHDLESEGLAILVMDYAEGGDLAGFVAEQGPFSPRRTAVLGLQLVEALGALHRARVVHRDLKPGNILVSRRDTNPPHLLVADFGISRTMVDGVAQATYAAGTPGFAPPEQFRTVHITPATDIYALGAVLWYMATARTPSECGPAAARGGGLEGHVPFRMTGTAELAALIPRMMAEVPADRCPLSEVGLELAIIAGHEGGVSPGGAPENVSATFDLGDDPLPRRPPPASSLTAVPSLTPVPATEPAPPESEGRPPEDWATNPLNPLNPKGPVHATLREVQRQARYSARGIVASVFSGAIFAFSAYGVFFWLQRHGPAREPDEADAGRTALAATVEPTAEPSAAELTAAPSTEPSAPSSEIAAPAEAPPTPATPAATPAATPTTSPAPSARASRSSRRTDALGPSTGSLVIDAGTVWAEVSVVGQGLHQTGRTGGSLKPWVLDELPSGAYTLTWSDCQDTPCVTKHTERVSISSGLTRRCWDVERAQRCD